MSEKTSGPPRFMAQLLEELGWDQGTRIPMADHENQTLETQLINRHKEIQQLKEALALQQEKQNDLNKYKGLVQSEYQENTRLLFAHKQQMEQEVKLKQLSNNEIYSLERDIIDYNKQSKELTERNDKYNINISKLLKKADTLKIEVCNEKSALREWRDTLERHAYDINTIEIFTKQDTSKAKALEEKRIKRKLEHDKLQDRLNKLVADLNAEERACDRISVQVLEGLQQRKDMLAMWSGAVENLRQRDKDIRHIREDYAVLENECNKFVENSREQQAFYDQLSSNNAEARRENAALATRLGQLRLTLQNLREDNVTLDSEVRAVQRELENMQGKLEKLRIENKQIIEERYKKELALEQMTEKVKELKVKLEDSNDKTKSAERRAKQLEEMLVEEERYASQLTANQQRAMHCSFLEQQKLLGLKNEEKVFRMQLQAAKAVMSKLANKEVTIQRKLQTQRETLYTICYQVETIGARVSHMEGARSDFECSAELVEREERLKGVLARHAARVSLLERHSERLRDDMRRLSKEIEQLQHKHTNLQSQLKTALLNVEGGEKELKESREQFRKMRVEEALTNLRVAYASRAVAGLDDAAYTLDKQRLQLEAAMQERMVEISTRRDMFSVQKRSLVEDCGKLRGDVRERENRIEQLKKRYDILIASLGKDESGQQLSVSFFKIKFAAERAELREKGAALDADICRRTKEITAMEATLKVMNAAHTHFLRQIAPLDEDSPEIVELNAINKKYYQLRDDLKELTPKVEHLEERVNRIAYRRTFLGDKTKQLEARRAEAECELENARERVAKNQMLLDNAHDVVNTNVKRAKKLISTALEDWKFFQMALWIRDYSEAADGALQALKHLCESNRDMMARIASLLVASDLEKFVPTSQRRLLLFLQKNLLSESEKLLLDLLTGGKSIHRVAIDTEVLADGEALTERPESAFSSSITSTHSGMSLASGYTRRLDVFRKRLAKKIEEQGLEEDAQERAQRSTVSLNRITLNLDALQVTIEPSSRKFR